MTDPETGGRRRFRVAYIHSSEEQRETAAARERALTKAEEQLQRVKNGLGGRYYKTRKQVETRVARIIAPNIEGLITTRTGTRNGKPTLTWTRDQDAIDTAARTDGIYALATNLPNKRLTAGQILRDYKGQQIVERRHRDYKQTLKVRPIFLHNDDRIYTLTSIIGIALLIFGLIETETRKALGEQNCSPACCPRTAQRNPPDVTSSASSKDSASPTLTPASSSTASPTHNAASSNSSRSHHPGPSKHRPPLLSPSAENGASPRPRPLRGRGHDQRVPRLRRRHGQRACRLRRALRRSERTRLRRARRRRQERTCQSPDRAVADRTDLR